MPRPTPDRATPLEADAVLSLFRSADALRRYFVALLADAGITLPQYNVLRILRGAGGELPTMEIRERMMERAPGITRILDGLVAKGLVRRSRASADRRQVPCRLTRRGTSLLVRMDQPMDAADRQAFSGLGKDRLRALIADLQKVEENLPDR